MRSQQCVMQAFLYYESPYGNPTTLSAVNPNTHETKEQSKMII